MSVKIERDGQTIGPYVVQPDQGVRSKRGEVVWPLLDTRTGNTIYRKTYRVIRLARQYGSPAPGQRMGITEVTT